MLQAEGCAAVARVLKQRGINIWCYSGFTFEYLLKRPECLEFLHYIDVLVDGRFIPELKSYDLVFRGSANQRLINVSKSLKENRVILLD